MNIFIRVYCIIEIYSTGIEKNAILMALFVNLLYNSGSSMEDMERRFEMILFMEYPKCSTCKKAKSWLDAHGIVYTDRHIKEENPTEEELKQWYQKSGLPLKRFFNTSGLQYRELGLKDRLPEMSEEAQIRLLATDGMLVKRPVIVGEDFVLTGFRESEWEKALLKQG